MSIITNRRTVKVVEFTQLRTLKNIGLYYHKPRRFLNLEKTEEYGPRVRVRDSYLVFHKQMLKVKTMESNGYC